MSFHWERRTPPPLYLYYRNLKFPPWGGYLTRDEQRSGNSFYAFFGGVKLTDTAIRYRVDRMIEKGLYHFEAA